MKEVLHGVASQITVEDPQEVLFKGIPPQLEVGRYHSWAVVADSISAQLKVTARAKQPEVMAIRHTHYDVAGLQFHPESVLTPLGKEIIKNWVEN